MPPSESAPKPAALFPPLRRSPRSAACATAALACGLSPAHLPPPEDAQQLTAYAAALGWEEALHLLRQHPACKAAWFAAMSAAGAQGADVLLASALASGHLQVWNPREPGVLDLHGWPVNAALAAVRKALKDRKRLTVVPGRGRWEAPRLLPAVEAELRKHGRRYARINPGRLDVFDTGCKE